MSQHKVIIALGGNTPETLNYFTEAKSSLSKEIGDLIATSHVYQALPMVREGVDASSYQPYLNAVASFKTQLSPREVLERCLMIERKLGRLRSEGQKWAPRTLDLDIIDYDSLTIREKDLSIPHPEMHSRDFVLIPLADIEPSYMHPTLQVAIPEMLASISHRFVERVIAPRF